MNDFDYYLTSRFHADDEKFESQVGSGLNILNYRALTAFLSDVTGCFLKIMFVKNGKLPDEIADYQLFNYYDQDRALGEITNTREISKICKEVTPTFISTNLEKIIAIERTDPTSIAICEKVFKKRGLSEDVSNGLLGLIRGNILIPFMYITEKFGEPFYESDRMSSFGSIYQYKPLVKILFEFFKCTKSLYNDPNLHNFLIKQDFSIESSGNLRSPDKYRICDLEDFKPKTPSFDVTNEYDLLMAYKEFYGIKKIDASGLEIYEIDFIDESNVREGLEDALLNTNLYGWLVLCIAEADEEKEEEKRREARRIAEVERKKMELKSRLKQNEQTYKPKSKPSQNSNNSNLVRSSKQVDIPQLQQEKCNESNGWCSIMGGLKTRRKSKKKSKSKRKSKSRRK